MKTFFLFAIIVLLFSCTSSLSGEYDDVDELNTLSCNSRYSNLDTCFIYAKKALELSSSYADGAMFARINFAFVAFQKMDYNQAFEELAYVFEHSKSQIELLSADVMAMKLCQRTGKGRQFFDHRYSALQRLNRVDEDYHILSEYQRNRVEYERTSLHLICATYYYYMGLYDAFKAELKTIDKNNFSQLDKSLLFNYDYLEASCPINQFDTLSSSLHRYDMFILVYAESRRLHNLYFQANSLQALSNLLCDSSFCRIIKENRSFSFNILKSLRSDTISITSFSLDLAQESVRIFQEYGDVYQSSCSIRTLGDLQFQRGNYSSAHTAYLQAQDILDSHSSTDSSIVLPGSILLSERLSRSYSAMGEKELSQEYRNAYLDYLDNTRQDIELDSRRASLVSSLHSIRIRLFLLIVILTISVLFAPHLLRRISQKSNQSRKQLMHFRNHPNYIEQKNFFATCQKETEEILSEFEEETEIIRISIENELEGYVERRTKIAVVKSIVPFLDRMLDIIRRLPESKSEQQQEQIIYLKELTNGLFEINKLLTQWIPIRQGNVKMHVTVFPIQSLIDTLSLAQTSFQKKGINLLLDHTEEKVRADKALTLFMLNTLLDNASKFTSKGGSVHVQIHENDKYVELAVQDSGQGLCESDVDTINNSKIYDPEKIANSAGHKGFGFGILNCKGIIQHYRKLSSLFSVCEFGVNSRLGEGSRFWFRLPRVLSLFFLFFCTLSSISQNIQQQYECLFQSNIEGRYAQGLEHGEIALAMSDSCRDTFLLMNLHNEMAIAALALQKWDIYSLHNSECLRLHRLYTQDLSLVSDYAKMQRYKTNDRILYVLLIIAAVLVAFIFYVFFLRDSIHNNRKTKTLYNLFCQMCTFVYGHEPLPTRRKVLVGLHVQAQNFLPHSGELYDLENSIYKELSEALLNQYQNEEKCLLLADQKERLSYEHNRLYIQNQILDNCLSTIKHETMSYPSRVLQIVEFMQKNHVSNISELKDFVSYYRSVYGILYEQALQQLQQSPFLHQMVSLPEFVESCQSEIAGRYKKISSNSSFLVGGVDSLVVISDPFLLRLLIMQLLHTTFDNPCKVICSVKSQATYAKFCLSVYGLSPIVDVHTFFDPLPENIPYLIARQIIRDHDALSGHPGLRLTIEEISDGYQIEFTLKTIRIA